jgi:hypothetical protein
MKKVSSPTRTKSGSSKLGVYQTGGPVKIAAALSERIGKERIFSDSLRNVVLA